MQKIIYIAHMFHLGRKNNPLVNGYFEAWDYGPVHPDLYHKAKVFGANHVKNIFRTDPDLDDDMEEVETLKSTLNTVCDYTGARLVAITHWQNGAWYKNYRPGEKFIIIPDEDILEEYNTRKKDIARRAKQPD